MNSYNQPSSLFLITAILVCICRCETETLSPSSGVSNKLVPAIYVLGDSTVDSGNNNYILTAISKANFPPYGRDFVNHTPTGRPSNGRLMTDFIASYVGVKDYVPPYLDSTLSLDELLTGVTFASAGSGYNPTTPPITGAIPITQQLQYFKEYKAKLEVAIGKNRTENHIKESLFVVSCGSNDFVFNPLSVTPNYEQFLSQLALQFVQNLWDQGARRIAILGLPPLHCAPFIVNLTPHHRRCIEASSREMEYNRILQSGLKAVQTRLGHLGAQIIYVDFFQPFIDMVLSPNKFGFQVVDTGCCGGSIPLLCNAKSFVCLNDSNYVFWDYIHPTEKAYYIIFKSLQSNIDSITTQH